MRQPGLSRRRTAAFFATATLVGALALASCEDDQAPQPGPQGITIVSGDGQYSKQGTELEQPVVFGVTMEDGKPGEGVTVNFQVVEGGGTLSRTSARANSGGETSVRWTMGPVGPQRLRATVADNGAITVQALATSSDYYCPEEDPAFARKFSPQGDLLLLTKESVLNQSGANRRVGVVQITPSFPGQFSGASLVAWDEGALLNIVRDCAFSANGDFFVAWTQGSAVHEIMKIAPDGSSAHFATLQSSFGSEIDILPGGALAGCDEFGPFTVGCRDTLTRYPDDTFSGTARDACNLDAMAVDPASGDLYYIYKGDRALRRLLLDGHAQTGATEHVATLSLAEADSSNGMAVDERDGSIYLLVESESTRGIVKVTAAGVKTTEVDFYAERGAGDLAGMQSDLAIDRNFHFLYTLDTLNNVILIYDINGGALGTPLVSTGDPAAASGNSEGERVGLAVMP